MSTSELRGADLVVRVLERLGVRTVFSLSGNHIMPIYDALVESSLRLIHVRHEAACVHMADAYARLSGEVGVALVTGGQGHTNACAALFTAQATEAPLLLLSGHAGTNETGLGAFQELRQAAIAAPMTKAAWTAERADDLGHLLARAAGLARSGRAGPVHVSLPVDLLESVLPDAAGLWPLPASAAAIPMPPSRSEISELLLHLQRAQRPLILCGPGQSGAGGRTALRRLQSQLSVPALVMESPRGINDPTLGAFAEVLAEADLVVLLGKPLDFTLKFGRAPFVAEGAGFIVVDADSRSVDRIESLGSKRLRLAMRAAPSEAIDALLATPDVTGARSVQLEWLARVEAAVRYRPSEWQSVTGSPATGRVHPLELCAALQRFIDGHAGTLLVCDGGEIGQWPQAAVEVPLRMINGVAGSIGPSLPFAIGASVVRQRDGVTAPVVVVMGDGTAGFHIAEFDTAVRYGLPVIVVIGNDARWNAEHQIQLRDYGADRALHCELLPTHYEQAAAAFGAHAEFVTDASQLDGAFQRSRQSGKSACINVMIESVPAPVIRRPATTMSGAQR
jgi:acetolactate synthase-1/2/3 large subunit